MTSMGVGGAAGRARHLMTGVSALAIVLAMGVADPQEALAQLELDGPETAAVDIGDGQIVVNDVDDGAGGTDGDFGAIDTNDGGTNPASVSLANDGTITVSDSDGGNAETATVAGSFVINTGVAGTIIFMQADTGAAAIDGNAAGLAVTGNLDGGDGLPGGSLNVTAREGIAQDDSVFSVAGDTSLGKVTVQAGNSGTADGGNLRVTFGDDSTTDTFAAGSLSVDGGTSTGELSGGDVSTTLHSTTATVTGLTQVQGANGGDGQAVAMPGAIGGGSTLILNIGDTGALHAIEVNGGRGGTGASDDPIGPGGDGGAASLTLNGGTTTATTMTVAAGNGGNGGLAGMGGISGSDGGNGGAAMATIAAGTSLTLSGDAGAGVGLAVNAGSQGVDGTALPPNLPGFGGAGGKATLTLEGALSVLDDIGINGGRIAITEGGSLETTGDVNGTEAAIELGAGGSFAFTNDAANQSVTDTSFNGGGTLRFTGDNRTVSFDTAIGESERLGALEFTDGADATFQDMVDVIAMTIGEDSEATFQTESSISGSATGDGLIRFDAQANDVLTFGTPVAMGGSQTEAHSIATDVLIGTANQGIFQINNTGGLTFEGLLGGENRAEGVQIGENSVVAFNNTVTTDDFTVQGAGTDLTFNADSQSQVIIGDGDAGGLTLDDGTITLGNSVGNGDTVFNINAGDSSALPINNADPDGIALNLAVGFTEGSIALIDTNGLDFSAGGAADALINAFTVTNTTFADYTIQAREGAADILEVTASANSTEEVGADIGVNTEQASALTNFIEISPPPITETVDRCDQPDAAFDLVCMIQILVANLQQMAMNAHTLGMQTAAQTVGTQSSTSGGGTSSAQSDFNAVSGVTSSRGAGTSDGQSGLSAGDGYADGQAVDLPPMHLWIEGYGGIAGADGDANGAGYDSSFGGLVLGLEGDLTEDLTVGLFGSYSQSSVDGDGPANASIDATSFGFGAYANYRMDAFYLSGTARFAIIDNDLVRTATVGATTTTVTADYQARQYGVSLSGGYDVEIAPSFILTPHAELAWTHYDADSYTETGVAVTQRVNPDSVSELTGTIGARISRAYANFDGAGTTFTPELSLAVKAELMGDDSVSTVAFTNGGSSYQVTGTDTADIGALVGFGATFENDNWTATLGYDAELRSDFQSHTGSARLSLSF
ncbi:MAG: autotransporter outer membrane beta-barrel domain-containing protein [Pseudomonadota bacterium]